MSSAFKETTRSAFILYRILQVRYATRSQIKQYIFGSKEPNSQQSLASNHLKPMEDMGCLKSVSGSDRQKYYYVSETGRRHLLEMLSSNRLADVDNFKDKLAQIDASWIEPPENPGNSLYMGHRLLVSDTVWHFLNLLEFKTAFSTKLVLSEKEYLKPDQTLLDNGAVVCIEAENEGSVKDLKETINRYIRYYFSGAFKLQFPDKKYMRVYVVHQQRSKRKQEEALKYLLDLTYDQLGFKKPIHETNNHLGRNLFRFGLTDFQWIRPSDYAKELNNGIQVR